MKQNLDFLKGLHMQESQSGVSTGRNWLASESQPVASYSPVDGQCIGWFMPAAQAQYEQVIQQAVAAFQQWRLVPPPVRGEFVRRVGEKLREYKQMLGQLVSYEMGKSLQEGWGEVQEMIDICDFAVGLSRQLYGLTMASERPSHRMFEQWHPLGPVGVITAFNFPVSVWSWNAMIAWVCGDVVVWKPSEKTTLCAIACQRLIGEVMEEMQLPEGLSCLVSGFAEVGQWLAADRRIPLVSATGSVKMGRAVAATVASRLGRTILELSGNNAIIISQHADLDLALRAAVFGAVGTAGQRCTTTRRLIVHRDVYDRFKEMLKHAYGQLRIGNPLDASNHVGPLIDQQAVQQYLSAIAACKQQGGKFLVEGGVLEGPGYESGCYVKPCIAEVTPDMPIVQEETFAPILYIMPYQNLDEAIAIHNAMPQGLSSAIMTLNLRESEYFLSAAGSDCGIANVNLGTSGAEIGGAFGGEKDTGGGRESGSDAWKNYMRRQTCTINYGAALPLAQGIRFEITGS
ncbi:L-piperidine-6-carboxylate dehydrogenase [Thermoflavifilum thermophilum]|uniref:aldehyde dehydrogenase (NAD(+)) n=1 Tax=Thermoflavifilum thermophilum TaxID=1393122 RepID=A0A1I7NJK1_9BACT|nr:aldehyde dehydrogenase family protein [Thermoflavifilum thermophilum]SFV34818.1 aldehyde dehydrogenase (NAD+) [Thermoflavifilum thermophilum]